MTDLLSLIGSSAFLPSLLAYVRNSSLGNLPLDTGIFQAILQCMVAGDKYLILLTPEEDVPLVVRLAVWTLSSIFDLPTHKAKIRSRTQTQRRQDLTPHQNPNLFLRSLFLPSNRGDVGESSKLSRRSRSRSNKRYPSFARPASVPNDPHHFTLSARTSVYNSKLNDVPDSSPSLPSHLILAPQPRSFFHANTDPLPLLSRQEPEFPHALVLQGLEHASLAEQTALSEVLIRRQVVLEPARHITSLFDSSSRRAFSSDHNGDHHHKSNTTTSEELDYQGTWNLPNDFILVSVCPLNSRERPKIHRSMLDLFAMSSTIYVQKLVRDAWKALPFTANTLSLSRKHSYSNPPTPTPSQPSTSAALLMALPGSTHRRHSRSRLSQQVPVVPKQLIPRDFIVSLQKAALSAHVSSQLSLYMSDLFSAVRHHPKLDGTFLTAKSMNDAYDLARAGRVLGIDPTGGELLRSYPANGYEVEDDDSTQGQLTSEIHEYIASGSESVTLNVPRESTSSYSAKDHDANVVPISHPQRSTGKLFVSEAAIARVVSRAVTHRIRLRDGPSDEILAGAVFGAALEPKGEESSGTVGYGWDTRITVKDILVEILAEV